ncbi:heparin lyase I family protein [Pelagibacterales bacterium SAG-MED20]|nr:heparin lyase I family protein [Pelagibacterales bacterium SAG-MED20]
MNKLSLVILFIFFWSNTGFTEDMNVKKKIKFSKDIVQGYKNDMGSLWGLSCTYSGDNKCMTPNYAYKIVSKDEYYPVRLGKKSVRMELRKGDCHQKRKGSHNDCKASPPAERHEFAIEYDKSTGINGKIWHAHSMFLPSDTSIINSEWITMGQFHNIDYDKPPVNFDLKKKHFELVTRFHCIHPSKLNKSCNSDDNLKAIKKIINTNKLFGQWNDFVVNANWTSNIKEGFFKLWVNGKLVYHFVGRTVAPKDQITVQFGIYRGAARSSDDANHVVYYDEIRKAKSCKKLKLEKFGYFCKDLENQKMEKIYKLQ